MSQISPIWNIRNCMWILLASCFTFICYNAMIEWKKVFRAMAPQRYTFSRISPVEKPCNKSICPFNICTGERISLFRNKSIDSCIILSCNTCAFVTGSGHLIGKGLGEEIDSMDCVIRSNDSPILGYESDVGTRTTLRTVDRRSLDVFTKTYKKNKKTFGNISETVFLYYSILHLPEALVNAQKAIPGLNAYRITDEHFKKTMNYYEKMVLNPSKFSPNDWISSGFYTIYASLDICYKLHVYGISPNDTCSKMNKSSASIPYHYYGEFKGRTECDVFNDNEKYKNGHHRFFREKSAFADIQKEWRNLYFHAPEWESNAM